MTEKQAMQLLKIPNGREVLIKSILVIVIAVMTLVSVILLMFSANLKLKKDNALLQAASVKPVTFTQDDALALLRKKNAVAAGTSSTQDSSSRGNPALAGTMPNPQQGNGGGLPPGGEMSRGDNVPPEGVPGGRRSGMRGRRSGAGSGDSPGGMQGGPGIQGGPGMPGGPSAPTALTTEMVGLVETRPLFGAPPKSGPPQANLQGILGDQALINGNWIKVGENQGGIKLIATMADKVTVEIEGQQRDITVWQDLPSNAMPSGPSGGAGQGRGGSGLTPAERAAARRGALLNGGSVNPALRGTAASRRGLAGANGTLPVDLNTQNQSALRGSRRGSMGASGTVPNVTYSDPAPPLPDPGLATPGGRGGRRMTQGGAAGAGGAGNINNSGGPNAAARTPRPATTGGGPTRAGRRDGAAANTFGNN